MRQPKPFYRKYTKSWYVQFGDKKIPLGKDKEAAFAKCHQLIALPDSLDAHTTGVRDLLNSYLDWVEKHRALATYNACRFYLSSFARSVGVRLRINDLRHAHVSDWISTQATWGDTTRHEAISHVQRAFSWAVKRRLIHAHPLTMIDEKPQKKRREVILTPAQWIELRQHLTEPRFRDLLSFLWETGCRPLEARSLEARYCDFPNRLAVFPIEQSKGGKRRRVLLLTDKACEIAERNAADFPQGPLFRNLRNRPWTKDAMKDRFKRLLTKFNCPGLCAYSFRHSYATKGLINGVDPVTLGHLMGHVDGTMVSWQGQHLAANF